MLSIHPARQVSITYLDSPWTFAACWIAAGMLLYLAGTPPSGPAVFPDEVCRLGWARLLSGTGPHYEMSPGAYCQPYYAMLLAPIQWLTHDPVTVHRAIFTINTALAAFCLPLAIRLGIRHFGMTAGTAWVAGIAILAYPSLTLYSHHALPETMLFPSLLLAFALWCNWIDTPGWRRFTVLLAMSLALYALHRKMLVVPLALMAGTIAGYWFNRTQEYRLRTLLAAFALAIAFLLDDAVKNMALSSSLQTGDAGAVDLLARLFSLEHLKNGAGRAAGVLVYATLLTGGCIWLVVAGGLKTVVHSGRAGLGSLGDFEKKSAFAFLMVVLMVAVTATYFSKGTRFDLWFYGRHVDAALAISLLPAIAMITSGRADTALTRWAVALAGAIFLILVAVIPGPPWADFSPIHVIGAGTVMEWMYQADDRWVLLAYCSGILALAGTVYLARLPGLFRFVALAPFAILTTITHLTMQPFKGVPIEAAIPASAANMLREAEPCRVHYDSRGGGRLRLHQYFRLQYYFPNCTIELVPADHSPPPASLVVALRIYTDCGAGTECHDLHPDLVLYQTAGDEEH